MNQRPNQMAPQNGFKGAGTLSGVNDDGSDEVFFLKPL
jgi:hypothetical protein